MCCSRARAAAFMALKNSQPSNLGVGGDLKILIDFQGERAKG